MKGQYWEGGLKLTAREARKLFYRMRPHGSFRKFKQNQEGLHSGPFTGLWGARFTFRRQVDN